MKNYINKLLLASILFATPIFAADGIAVVDVRAAILSTQAAADAFKALEEDADYSSNLEEAQSIEADRQALAEKLQKDAETLSSSEITEAQRDIQEQTKDLEFLVGKLQAAREETFSKLIADKGPVAQRILSELIAAKQIKVLLAKSEVLLYSDQALDLTDDLSSMLDVAASEGAAKTE